MSLINLADVDTFNHKFAGTLVFSEVHKLWIFCEGNIGNGIIKNSYLEGRDKLVKRLNLKVADAKFSKDIPSIQYYNDFDRGEAAYFRRTPRRGVKQTITAENTNLRYIFWEYLPQEMQAGLGQGLPYNLQSILHMGWLLNNHKQLTFEEALDKLNSAEMASAAFDKQFMLSLSIADPSKYLLWYTHMPIGNVCPASKRITVNRGPFTQEVKDILVKEKCSWIVIGEGK